MGSSNRETQVMYVWHDAPAQVLEDARAREIVMGGQAPGSTQFDYPVLANKLFGFKFKVVTGYESTPKIHLAMESGEVHGHHCQLVDAQGHQHGLDHGQESSHPRAMGAAKKR